MRGFWGGAGVRQWSVVLLNTGSQTYSTAGMTRRQMHAEISAPRASMMQMAPMRSIEDTKDTPSVAQNSTSALVMIEASEESAAMRMASMRLLPLCSSS